MQYGASCALAMVVSCCATVYEVYEESMCNWGPSMLGGCEQAVSQPMVVICCVTIVEEYICNTRPSVYEEYIRGFICVGRASGGDVTGHGWVHSVPAYRPLCPSPILSANHRLQKDSLQGRLANHVWQRSLLQGMFVCGYGW